MNMAVPHRIGASLILGVIAASILAARAYWFDRPKIEFMLLRSVDGHLGLGVVLNSQAWRYATAGSPLPGERVINLPVPHQRFSAIVAKGIEMDHLAKVCPGEWSFLRFDPIPGGSMLVSCYCIGAGTARAVATREAL